MKKFLLLAGVGIVAFAALLFYRTTIQERELVILSTNDIHAHLKNFPRLATAVAECRDTVDCILVDAGDRWTGNSYVDLAEGRLPIIDLMNEVGYDIVTLGNHEFDMGPALLQGAIDHSQFATICSNMVSNHPELTTLPAHKVITTRSGIDVSFVGVVTNYDNGHPDGDNRRFEGLVFSDPVTAARKAAEESPASNVRVLLSHIADDKDMAFAADGAPFDLIVSGHSHHVVDTLICNTVIGQTGKNMPYLGATRIRLKGRKIVDIDYENIDLKGYAEDCNIARHVQKIEDNPYLNETIGTISTFTNRVGFANLETQILKEAAKADVALYHCGGIRITHFEPGMVTRARLYDLEPFASQVVVRNMTLAQLQALVKEKFNDKGNTKESHRVDIFCTAPYDIVVGADGEAVAVRFPTLRAGKSYRVAMPDYISRKYPTLKDSEGEYTDMLVLDCITEYVEKHSPIKTCNTPRQRIVKR